MNKKVTNATAGDVQIVKMLAEDVSRADIAAIEKTKVVALSKRIDRIRAKNDCKSVAALVYLFAKNGLIT